MAALSGVAEEAGASPAQVAIAWLLAQGPDIVPIPGTKKVKWLDENIAAVDLVLSAGQMAALEEAFPAGVTAGDRYPPGGMKRVGL